MYMRAFFLSLAALFLLASCAPFSVKPEAAFIASEDVASGKSIALALDAQWPRRKWWEIFGDRQLNDLIEKAMRQSPTLRVAEARVRQARGATLEAGAGRFPQLNGNAGAQRIHLPDSSEWNNSALLEASFVIDLWGRERSLHKAALSLEQAAVTDARAAELVLQSSITQTYILLAQNIQLLDVARDMLEARQNTYRITRDLFMAGMTTELALSQAEATLPSSRARIMELESEIDVLKFQLAALCGEGPDMAFAIERPNLLFQHVQALPASFPAELVGRRPDIVALKWRAEAAAERINAARADFYPNFSLSAAIGYVGVGFSHFLTARTAQAQFGPALTLPIFQGGALLGRLEQRDAEYDEAVESYNEAVFSAFSAVAEQMRVIAGLKERVVEVERALELAQRSYAIANRAYSAGLTDYLDVLSAENTLLAQQETNVQIKTQQLSAVAGLINELGGGYGALVEESAGALHKTVRGFERKAVETESGEAPL